MKISNYDPIIQTIIDRKFITNRIKKFPYDRNDLNKKFSNDLLNIIKRNRSIVFDNSNFFSKLFTRIIKNIFHYDKIYRTLIILQKDKRFFDFVVNNFSSMHFSILLHVHEENIQYRKIFNANMYRKTCFLILKNNDIKLNYKLLEMVKFFYWNMSFRGYGHEPEPVNIDISKIKFDTHIFKKLVTLSYHCGYNSIFSLSNENKSLNKLLTNRTKFNISETRLLLSMIYTYRYFPEEVKTRILYSKYGYVFSDIFRIRCHLYEKYLIDKKIYDQEYVMTYRIYDEKLCRFDHRYFQYLYFNLYF